MLPYLLAVAGGYLIGSANKNREVFADGGMMAKGGVAFSEKTGKLEKIKHFVVRNQFGKEILKTKSFNKAVDSKYGTNNSVYVIFEDGNERKLEQGGMMADGGMMAKGGMGKGKYKIIQDVSDMDDPSGAWLVIDTEKDKILGEFDFKKEAQSFVNDLKYKDEMGLDEGGGILSNYEVIFQYEDYDGETRTAKSKPIKAHSEDEAAIMLIDQFESYEGIDCNVLYVKKVD
jgi:hypothetical protein